MDLKFEFYYSFLYEPKFLNVPILTSSHFVLLIIYYIFFIIFNTLSLMGTSCVGCSGLGSKKKAYSFEPSDIEQYIPDSLSYKLQKLNFQAQVDNVQVLNYPFQNISIKFSIEEVLTCYLPKIKNQNSKGSTTQQNSNYNTLKWKFSQKYSFSMDEYELRKSFIKLSVFRQEVVPILTLNLNLYLVVTGPYHHDLQLDFGHGKCSRILFDFKTSQNCTILMNPLSIHIELNQQFPGEQFSYSFSVFSCRKKVCTSEASIPKRSVICSNVSGNYRQLTLEDQCESPTRIRKGTDMCKVIKTVLTSKIDWEKPDKLSQNRRCFKQSQKILEQETGMPSFKFSLKSNEINKSSVQLVLWDICLNKTNMKEQAIMFADTYIPLMKIFQTEYKKLQALQNDSQESEKDAKKIMKKLENRVCQWSQNLIKDGKVIGKILIKFKIVNQIHFSQMPLHARTEDGIIYMTSMFKTYAGNSGIKQNNKNILLISQTFQGLVQLLVKFNTALKDHKLRKIQNIGELQQEIGLKFLKLHDRLVKSYEQSFVLNHKSKIQSIIQCQNILLNIVERTYIFLSDDSSSRFAQNCWKILLDIMKRGEFYLQHIGFNEINLEDLDEGLKEIKLKTSLKYMQLAYKVLTLALNQNYDDSNNIIIEAEAYKAYSYFRIPKFREEFLKQIMKKQDDQLIEQNISDLFDSQKLASKNSFMSQEKSLIHLDWQKYLYSYLQNFKQYRDFNQKLMDELHQNNWMKNLAKRQTIFHTFIDYFARKIKQLGKRLKITRYSYCPGYNKIIKCFLAQMKKKPLLQYEASMIQSSMMLMANSNLINIVFPIIAQKTDRLDNNCFVKGLNITMSYLNFLTQNGTKILPQKFNNCYFFKIVKIVLESEYSIGVAKMLVIIHTFFQCFDEDLREIICLYFLSKAFFKLFFHWSYNVRVIFHHLFLIKIYWGKINGVTEKANKIKTEIDVKNIIIEESSQLYQRYKALVKIINSAQFKKSQQKKLMRKEQKEDYYIKMRNKLRQKKKVIESDNPGELIDSNSNSSVKSIESSLSHIYGNNGPSKSHLQRSETLCSAQIKGYLRAFVKNDEAQRTLSNVSLNNLQYSHRGQTTNFYSKDTEYAQIQKYCINLKIKKSDCEAQTHKRRGSDSRKSFSTTSDGFPTKQNIKKLNQELNLNPLTLTKKNKSYTEQKQLYYSFFGHQDYQLEEMSLNQSNKVLVGMSQFRQAQAFIQKYILEKGVAPHINLDPEVEMDSNQPRPF